MSTDVRPPTSPADAGSDTTPTERCDGGAPVGPHVVPEEWRRAGDARRPVAVRKVRSPEDYRTGYPTFGASGLVAATWEVEQRRLGWIGQPLGLPRRSWRPTPVAAQPPRLNLTAPLSSRTHEDQRRRFLPRSFEPRRSGASCQRTRGRSDLASRPRARSARDEWVVTGQKIWTTWADQADFAVLLAAPIPHCQAQRHQPTASSTCGRRGLAETPATHGGERVLPGVPRRSRAA